MDKLSTKERNDLDKFKEVASSIIKKDFEIDEFNIEPIRLVIMHFQRNPKFESNGKLSLNKDIALFGPVGSGKSIIFKTIQKLFTYPNNFPIRSDLDIRMNFSTDGYGGELDGVKAYMGWPRLVIDDIGTFKGDSSHYAQRSNVTSEIITARYENDLFGEPGKFTHVTTNLNSISDISDYFGDRVASRMAEMFNFILVNSASDRRLP